MNQSDSIQASVAMRRWEPYPRYKQSEVEWIDQFPAHWRGLALKRCVETKITDGPHETPPFVDEGIPFISAESIQDGRINFELRRGYISQALHEQYICKCHPVRGDILLCKSGATTGKLAMVDVDAEFSVWSPLAQIRADKNKVCSRFLFRALQAAYVQEQIRRTWSAGTQPNIGMGDIERLFLAIPPAREQESIAAFLDRETAKIDALIAKKVRLIELLQEKRTALITRAVTKGLDPNVPMKDSGVKWLGKIPGHWEVKRLRHLGEAIIGLTYEPSDVVGPDDRGVLVLRASNVSDGHIVLEDNVFVRCAVPDRLRTKLGDILICSRSGSRALIGKSAKIDGARVGLTFGTFMTVFRSVCNEYLFYVFNSTLFDYQSGTFLTSTINQLTVSNLKGLTVPVPPDGEPSAIATLLDRETARVDTLIAKVRDGIDRLREYRTALISAAVTGKIDVREASA